MSNVFTLERSYYQALKRLTLELAGVKLGEDHKFLVETRLSALARKEGFEDLNQMVDELFSRGQTRLAVHVVSALTERANQFFNDRKSFEILGDKLLPILHPLYRGGRLRILSYGCSSGQEVYSTAIVVDRLAHAFPDMEVEITGVDYPSWALEQAREGRFTHFEVQRGLPIRHLIEYFDKDGEDWVVKEKLRAKVRFTDHNLLADSKDLDTYQIAMFRGKISQFSPPALVSIHRALSKLVTTNGYLMLGSSEKLDKVNYGFDTEQMAPGVYKKRSPTNPYMMDEAQDELDKPEAKAVEDAKSYKTNRA